MWGCAGTSGEGLRDGVLRGPWRLLRVTPETVVGVRDSWEPSGLWQSPRLFQVSKRQKVIPFKMVLKFQQMPRKGFAIQCPWGTFL